MRKLLPRIQLIPLYSHRTIADRRLPVQGLRQSLQAVILAPVNTAGIIRIGPVIALRVEQHTKSRPARRSIAKSARPGCFRLPILAHCFCLYATAEAYFGTAGRRRAAAASSDTARTANLFDAARDTAPVLFVSDAEDANARDFGGAGQWWLGHCRFISLGNFGKRYVGKLNPANPDLLFSITR